MLKIQLNVWFGYYFPLKKTLWCKTDDKKHKNMNMISHWYIFYNFSYWKDFGNNNAHFSEWKEKICKISKGAEKAYAAGIHAPSFGNCGARCTLTLFCFKVFSLILLLPTRRDMHLVVWIRPHLTCSLDINPDQIWKCFWSPNRDIAILCFLHNCCIYARI